MKNILDITWQVTQWGDWQEKKHNNIEDGISPALGLIRAYCKLKVMCIFYSETEYTKGGVEALR